MLVFPLRKEKISRLIGLFPPSLVEKKQTNMDEFIPFLQENFRFNIEKVHWFSEYKIHHRLAERYRQGNVFLIGDAAHVHSPVGGQGMNAGIADSINLSWKMAAVIHQQHHPKILDTYESERRAYAKNLIQTTDRAFKGIIFDHKWVNSLRERLAPHLLHFFLNKAESMRERLFGTVSQLFLEYKESPLNAGDSKLRGKRLPYYKDNSQFTDSMAWQLHIYGKSSLNCNCFQKTLSQLRFLKLHGKKK